MDNSNNNSWTPPNSPAGNGATPPAPSIPQNNPPQTPASWSGNPSPVTVSPNPPDSPAPVQTPTENSLPYQPPFFTAPSSPAWPVQDTPAVGVDIPATPNWPPVTSQQNPLSTSTPFMTPSQVNTPQTLDVNTPGTSSFSATEPAATPLANPAVQDNFGLNQIPGSSMNTQTPLQTQYLSSTPYSQGFSDQSSFPSTLDNPYGSPVQPPPIDGGPQAPAWAPPQTTSSSPDLPQSKTDPEGADIGTSGNQANPQQYNAYETTPNTTPPVNQSEQAPTDLSHLISSSESTTGASQIQPETMVVPQTTPEIPAIPTEHKGGIPKWIIGLGVGLLIIVAGASAYFILGIGQSPKNTSLPATEAPPENQTVATPAPITPPVSQQSPVPEATNSPANFGELQGSGATPQATSAADLLKARQQQQQGR